MRINNKKLFVYFQVLSHSQVLKNIKEIINYGIVLNNQFEAHSHNLQPPKSQSVIF